jgi:hypothetical protein
MTAIISEVEAYQFRKTRYPIVSTVTRTSRIKNSIDRTRIDNTRLVLVISAPFELPGNILFQIK